MKAILEVVGNRLNKRSYELFRVNLSKTSSAWHYHPEIELTYVLEGEGIRQVGDHIGHFKAGDIMLTGENLAHDFLVQNKGDKALFLVIQFNRIMVTQFPELEELTEMLNRAKQGLVFKNAPEETLALLSNLESQHLTLQWINFYRLLEQLSRISSRERLCSDSFSTLHLNDNQLTRVSQVIEFVNDNYNRPIELQEIAQKTFMTVPSFCRWFKRTMGSSFVTYLNKCRVQFAAHQLVSTDFQISVIATDSGFDSISSFNRAFKKYREISPKAYRKQFQAI